MASFDLNSITSSIGNGIGSVASGIGNIAKKAIGALPSILDPSGSRLSIANLMKGGGSRAAAAAAAAQGEVRVNFESSGNQTAIDSDWRVRIGVSPSSGIFYTSGDSGIMNPLTATGGVIFPYTPSITTSYTAGYSSQKSTHSNYPAFFYENSEVSAIQLAGDFTVQTIEEGQYLLASIYFFRASTKMFFGGGSHPGNPPPILYLDGYGTHYFPHVPCLLTSFQHTMSPDVDYMEIPGLGGAKTRVPTVSQIQLGLQPVYSRVAQSNFDLDAFARGELIKGNGGFM